MRGEKSGVAWPFASSRDSHLNFKVNVLLAKACPNTADVRALKVLNAWFSFWRGSVGPGNTLCFSIPAAP